MILLENIIEDWLWCVYDHPRDFPNMFVARLWIVIDGAAVPTKNNHDIATPGKHSQRHAQSRACGAIQIYA